MALTGIQIFKQLPKTNCGECGIPTCLAFAMNLAVRKVELELCPYVSEEARVKLAEASTPPIRSFMIGYGNTIVKVGGETTLFRHEKTFYNPCSFAAVLKDTDSDILSKVKRWGRYKWERIGVNLRPEQVFLICASGEINKFKNAIQIILDNSDLSLILACEDPIILGPVVDYFVDKKPLLYAATQANADKMSTIAGLTGCSLAVRGTDLNELVKLTTELTEIGLKDLVIDSGARNLADIIEDNIFIRRAALLKNNRLLGFPIINFANAISDDLVEQTIAAASMITKYASIIILDDFQPESIFPLLLERLNIYTDPQRPMSVSEGIYEIGRPGLNSPIAVTTNFALTYFIISAEIESSRIPTWLLIKDTEGLSVMTAWAAGKFSSEDIAILVKKTGIYNKVNHKTLIIPGYAASIASELEEELPEHKIIIGPREAAHLPKFLKQWIS